MAHFDRWAPLVLIAIIRLLLSVKEYFYLYRLTLKIYQNKNASTLTCSRPSSVRCIVTHFDRWAPLVVIAVMKRSRPTTKHISKQKRFKNLTCSRPSSVLCIVTHLDGWAPLVVIAVIRLSSSSRFSLSFLTRDSMARLANDSLSPPCLKAVSMQLSRPCLKATTMQLSRPCLKAVSMQLSRPCLKATTI